MGGDISRSQWNLGWQKDWDFDAGTYGSAIEFIMGLGALDDERRKVRLSCEQNA